MPFPFVVFLGIILLDPPNGIELKWKCLRNRHILILCFLPSPKVLRQGEAIDQDFEYFKKSVKLAESKWHELKRETDRLDAGLDKQVGTHHDTVKYKVTVDPRCKITPYKITYFPA